MHVKETLYAWIASNTKGRNGHRRPNGEGGSGSRVQIPSGRNKQKRPHINERGRDATENGIQSRGNGHTCRMTSGGKKEETSEKQRKTACGTRGHRTPNGAGGSGSRVQIPSGRNGRSYAGIGSGE